MSADRPPHLTEPPFDRHATIELDEGGLKFSKTHCIPGPPTQNLGDDALMTYIGDSDEYPDSPRHACSLNCRSDCGSNSTAAGEQDEDLEMSDSEGGTPLENLASDIDDMASPVPDVPWDELWSPGDGTEPENEEYGEAHTAASSMSSGAMHHLDNNQEGGDLNAEQQPGAPSEPLQIVLVYQHPTQHPPHSPSSSDTTLSVFYDDDLQPAQQTQDNFQDEDFLEPAQISMSNPHPFSLGPDNLGLGQFLTHWAIQGPFTPPGSEKMVAPTLSAITLQMDDKIVRVRYDDLEGDCYDIQGLNWNRFDVTRKLARRRRLASYKNYTNMPESDKLFDGEEDGIIPAKESFFRFRRTDIRRNIYLAHFQLRSILASPSRSSAFYPIPQGIFQLNPLTGQGEVAMNLRSMPSVQVSTIGADCGILVGGTFNGEYCLRSLDSHDKRHTEGHITDHISGITNHLQIHAGRCSSSPLVAFASNDQQFRVLDVATQKFISKTPYDYPMNCSAVSPDKRLRVMVGDNHNVFITNAETGEVLQSLGGHRDYGFACDWSDNGWTVATGCQDMTVKVWDARRWTTSSGAAMPVCTLRSKMAGVRNLRFSPLGSGKPVLVATEEADYINIIDAEAFKSQQTFEIFSEIGGVAFTNEGQDLQVLCCDHDRGGLLQFERCDYGKTMFSEARKKRRRRFSRWDDSAEENETELLGSSEPGAVRYPRNPPWAQMEPF